MVPTAPSNQKYRPAIDGLRALSILPVILFHLKSSLLPGGFVGVDVFFVISGYLITTLLLRDLQQNRFSFLQFYQRRIARLFPSMAIILTISFLACLIIYDPRFIGDNGPHMAESVLSVANVFSAFENGGYFGITRDVHPFLHFWSLSVEEQFYICFPATLLLLWRLARNRILLWFSVLAAISLVASIYLTITHPAFAFYMLPTRAWELLAGAALASWELSNPERRGEKHPILGWIGFFLLLLSFLIIRPQHFPGAIALLPVMAALAILYVCTTEDNAFNRLLSLSWLVRIGQLSYVLYLWHLPIFCLIDYRMLFFPEWVRFALGLSLTFILTLLTSWLVETPARAFLNQRSHRLSAYGLAALLIGILVPIGVAARIYAWPEPKPELIACGGIAFNSHASNGSTAIIGDSQACATASTLHSIATEQGKRFNSMCVSSSVPLLGSADTRAWAATFDGIQHVHPDVLVIQLAWVNKPQLRQQLTNSIRALTPYVHHFVLITEYPILKEDLPREGVRNGARPPFFEDPSIRADRERDNNVVRSVAREFNIPVVDAARIFTGPDGSIPIFDAHDHPLYFDPMHLSALGVQRYKAELARDIADGQTASDSAGNQ